jgi:hypothetical protein
MRSLVLIAAVVLAVVATFAFTFFRKKAPVDRYDWLSGRSSPPFCPMEVESSHFLYRGGGGLYITPGFVDEGEWGDSSKIDIVGPDLKPLPDRLLLTYYSYWEDKIYRGDFALPYERIAELFRAGFEAPRQYEHVTYNKIIAGLAPGGDVTVWLSGIGRRIEVFHGRAEAVEVDWNRAMNHADAIKRDENRATELAALPDNATTRQLKERVPFELWARLRRRYAWTPVFENVPVAAYIWPAEYWNGEKNEIRMDASAPPPEGRAAPSKLFCTYVKLIDGQRRQAFLEVLFDRDQILSAFETLGVEGKLLELVLRHDQPGPSPTKFLLRDDTRSIPLDAHVTVFGYR